jgi:hypothetical protein
MKTAIVAFLMSAIVATGAGWIKDKLSFPLTAVDQVKALAADADSSNLAMKVLGADVDKMMTQGLQLCSVENKGATDPCVTRGVDFLKSISAKRDEIGKAAQATQTEAKSLSDAVKAAPFSGSVIPLLDPLLQRLNGAKDSIAASTAETDFSLAQMATRLAGMKSADGVHQAAATELESLKSGGLSKAFEKVQALADLAKGKH